MIPKSDSFTPGTNSGIELAWTAIGPKLIIFKSGIPNDLKKKTYDECILPLGIRMRDSNTQDGHNIKTPWNGIW